MSARLSLVRNGFTAWAVASLALGVGDAAAALWANRSLALEQGLALCLTAPLCLAALLLALPAAAAVLFGRLAGLCGIPLRDPFAWALGLILAACAALAGLRAGEAVLEAWRSAGRPAGPALALLGRSGPALLSAGVALVAVRAAAARIGARGRAALSLVAVAALLAAGAGLARLILAESRGLAADLVAAAVPRRSSAPSGGLRPGAAAQLGAAASGDLAAAEGCGTAPRHLVLITIDTLRADHLDARRMPNTTALAERGLRFDAAFASAPWTLPALASLMTGLPAVAHGAGIPTGRDPLARSALPSGVTTLAARLRRAGFATRAIVTNPYLGTSYGLDQGFEHYENLTLESEALLSLAPTLGGWALHRLLAGLRSLDRGAAVTRRATGVLERHTAGQRLFLWLHYVDPHAPYAGASRSFRADLLDAGAAAQALGDERNGLPRMAQLRAGEIRLDARGRRALREAYTGAVREVDRQVGAVLEALEASALARDALVVLTADHGEELWDHGGVEHGHTLYRELIEVPLVVVCPDRRAAGRRVAAPVAIEALGATLLDLLGVAQGTLAPGFAGLVRDPAAPVEVRAVLSENLLFAEERSALRTERHTYVRWSNGKEEVYDRRRDPLEMRDLAARRPLVARLRGLLEEARRAARSAVGGPLARPYASAPTEQEGSEDGAPERRPVQPPREVTRSALRALGYLE